VRLVVVLCHSEASHGGTADDHENNSRYIAATGAFLRGKPARQFTIEVTVNL